VLVADLARALELGASTLGVPRSAAVGSEVEDQAVAAGSGDAGHHGVACGALLFGQDRVAVVDLPGQHRRRIAAANTDQVFEPADIQKVEGALAISLGQIELVLHLGMLSRRPHRRDTRSTRSGRALTDDDITHNGVWASKSTCPV
jgi:hypothetical protein